MQQMAPFARSDDLPSWWPNALGKFLSVAAPQFKLQQTDATHVQVPASANAGAAVIAIAGLWRWVEATVGPVAHPGGAAGSYPIFVTAKNNNIVNVPQPFTDSTDYSFALQILAPGTTPTIVAGTVDVYRQVGVAEWDGAKIVRVDQTAPVSPAHAYQHKLGGLDPLSPTDIGSIVSGTQAQRLASSPIDGQLWRETDTRAVWLSVGGTWVLLKESSGVSVVAGAETRTNAAYGLMPTADQVAGVYVPPNGLLEVLFSGAWQESVQGAASADIFIGAVELNPVNFSSGHAAAPAMIGTPVAAGQAVALSSHANGLGSWPGGNTSGAFSAYPGDVNDQPVAAALPGSAGAALTIGNGSFKAGGPCSIMVPEGIYTVSIQFKAASGSVTASGRKLWARGRAFG